MRWFRAPGLGGPVGIASILVGYSVAVLVARTFVTLIAHCTQSCPMIRIEGFHLHHFYYGLGLVLISVLALSLVENVRSRWDAALVLGIGTGLALDEVGLVLLGAHYWSKASIIPILAIGLVVGMGLILALRLRGTFDFKILDGSDLMTILSVLLGVAGFLYFVRPVRMVVAATAVAFWVFAVLLMGFYGRRHVLKILRGQLRTKR